MPGEMKKFGIILSVLLAFFVRGVSQDTGRSAGIILFQGLVMDAGTMAPLPNSQIIIKKSLASVSDSEGKYAFYVNRSDTVFFTSLGYRSAVLIVSDTLSGSEFIAGIYLHSDTISIGEVIIMPKLTNLKSELFNTRPEASKTEENARYNLEISSYQGRVAQSKMGDPALNYEVLRQQQRRDAYSRGQIPSDRMVGLSPLMLIPAAYLLMHGLPEKPVAPEPHLTDKEINEIHEKYLESLKK
jgi:hypothetical protein